MTDAKNEFKNAYRQARINMLEEAHLEVPLIDEATRCLVERHTKKTGLWVRLMNWKAERYFARW